VERGLVFLPTGNPADSFYGADRKGANLYANCVLALDAATGKLRWYYQVVHHDIWDYDLSVPPALIDVKHDGKTIPALAEITKMGLLSSSTARPASPFSALRSALCEKVTRRAKSCGQRNRSRSSRRRSRE
jgi:quinoprotein glucose dehydrogenase